MSVFWIILAVVIAIAAIIALLSVIMKYLFKRTFLQIRKLRPKIVVYFRKNNKSIK